MFGSLPLLRVRLLVAFLLVAVLTLYTVPLAGAAPAATLVIDHFDHAQGPLVASLKNPAASFATRGDLFGGQRDMEITVLSGAAGSATVQVISSQLRHVQDAGIVAQTVVQWDGNDASMALNPNGLGTADLTQNRTQNGIAFIVLENNLPVDLLMRVYSGANSSALSLSLPGEHPLSAGPQSYYFPFAAFATVSGSGADFSRAGAVELLIDGQTAGTSITLDAIRTVAFDWGDLPDETVGGPNYPTRYVDNGPRHLIAGPRLGFQNDAFEPDGVPSIGATGDDGGGAPVDEDGVRPTPNYLWHAGVGGGSVDVTVTGGPGCLSGWIDWNNNGNLEDPGEHILSNVLVNTGATSFLFSIPIDPGYGAFYARFRLFALDAGGGCVTEKDPTGQAVTWEVEDHQWSFGPIAVEVRSFTGTAVPAALPAAALVLAAGLGVLVALGRRS